MRTQSSPYTVYLSLWNNGDADDEDWSYDSLTNPRRKVPNVRNDTTPYHKQWQ